MIKKALSSAAFLFFLLILSSSVFCNKQQFYINSPSYGITWNADRFVEITWKYYPSSDLPIKDIEIGLFNGPAIDAKQVKVLGQHINPDLQSYVVKVPTDVRDASDYFVRFTAYDFGGQVAEYDYSGRFALTGGESSDTSAPIEQAGVQKPNEADQDEAQMLSNDMIKSPPVVNALATSSPIVTPSSSSTSSSSSSSSSSTSVTSTTSLTTTTSNASTSMTVTNITGGDSFSYSFGFVMFTINAFCAVMILFA